MATSDAVDKYFVSLSEKYRTGQAREHAYRPAFEALMHALDPTLKIINDPSRSEHGNPDFIFLRGETTAGYTETKDIGVNLDKIEKSEQMERYLGYSNLILTDYLEFRFFRNGSRYGESVCVGWIESGILVARPEAFNELADALTDFLAGKPEPIRNGKRLAEVMGGKARRIRDNVNLFLLDKSERNKELEKIYDTIRELLVHDLNKESFADMYAQTLVYGLFAARYYDESADTFSRQEARDLIPASNPFLQHFFDHIAGPNFDKRLSYIVDELCEVFQHSDTKKLVEEYMSDADPIIHFYEDFLKEYDPDLRKKMGAYYTPLPVVNFIIRSVDQILKKDFSLVQGLADTTKLSNGKHKVQILDPAVGTGTFVSATIDKIYKNFEETGQKGRWPSYVHHDLLPRLHGFELMMSPYTIAHLKITLKLKETGFYYFNETRAGKARLGVYLTNSLEDLGQQQNLLAFDFGAAIAEEAKQASVVKNNTPIMVVLGNPPYSISSSNKGEWIRSLVEVYKENLTGERNINALSDDYVKFLRFAEYFIERNKTGVVAMITNNSFIDGITHRQMRKHILETFDKIYILDLHGNSKKKEKTLDGGKDENIFDIQQGVSINIFVRKDENKKELGTVYHSEVFGKREYKFETLDKSDVENVKWQKLDYSEPYFFFIPKDFAATVEYEKGFKLDRLFIEFGSGIKFRKDNLLVKKYFDQKNVEQLLQDINNLDNNSLYSKYDFNDTVDWKLDDKKRLFIDGDYENIRPVQYRPLDQRWTYFPPDQISQIIPRGDSRLSLMRNFLDENIGLISKRGTSGNWNELFVTEQLMDLNYLSAQTYVFPLYICTNNGSKVVNLRREIMDEIEKIVGKTVPGDIFDYVYAVLHSPKYRGQYKEFLKIDFPRVPYPKDKKQFGELVTLGRELREIHLLKSSRVNEFITTYPVAGSDTVERVSYKDGSVFINKEQYFGNVPEIVWNFYIGGYQPAQKWLKDRKDRSLTNEDIEHYQKIIVALVETNRLMKEIDKVIN